MESTTMEWAVKEIQLRLPSSGCEIVLPTVVAGAINQYNSVLNEHDSDQFMQWCERLSAASRVLVLLHSELPRHYTLLERKRVAEGEYQYKFWDSLNPPAETALARAQAFMDCLQWGAVPTTACNHRFQPDAWSCGFFSLHFLEEQVREHLQEPTVRSPVSLSRMITRINQFIVKVQRFLPPPSEPSPPAAFRCIGAQCAQRPRRRTSQCIVALAGSGGQRTCQCAGSHSGMPHSATAVASPGRTSSCNWIRLRASARCAGVHL